MVRGIREPLVVAVIVRSRVSDVQCCGRSRYFWYELELDNNVYAESLRVQASFGNGGVGREGGSTPTTTIRCLGLKGR